MVVSKALEKPKKQEVDVEALINKGAKVKEDEHEEPTKKWTYINLRIPVEMVAEIDGDVEDRVGMTRTGWILEAVQEKLKKVKLLSNES